MTMTFFATTDVGPPTTPVGLVGISADLRVSVGSYEGSLVGSLVDAAPGCPFTQTLTTTSDVDQFESVLTLITVSKT